MLTLYGAEHNDYVPEINERRKATNLNRYGAENPFASEVVKEKIRATNLAQHGAGNPQQVPAPTTGTSRRTGTSRTTRWACSRIGVQCPTRHRLLMLFPV